MPGGCRRISAPAAKRSGAACHRTAYRSRAAQSAALLLLRAILNTAVKEDEIIRQNPCRISGYDRYHTPERPVATVAQVLALAEQMPARFSALIIVAAFSGLRWGELAALRRSDVDLAAGTVRVPRKLAALRNRMEFGAPKSEASNRTVTLPAAARSVLAAHLDEFTGEGPDAIVFTGDKGAVLRTGNFRRAVDWAAAACAPRSSISTRTANGTGRSRLAWTAGSPRRNPRRRRRLGSGGRMPTPTTGQPAYRPGPANGP